MPEPKQPKIHELKSAPRYFWPVTTGEKQFELRRDDRNFAVGDLLRLREWFGEGTYSGQEVIVRIAYILRNSDRCQGSAGLLPDFAILGIKIGPA
jgi:hypothetical protein